MQNLFFKLWTYAPRRCCVKCCSGGESESCSVMSDSLWTHGLYRPWNFPGRNTGVGSLFLLQGIIPTQESNWGLLYCRWILYQLSYQGSPILEGNWIIKFRVSSFNYFVIYSLIILGGGNINLWNYQNQNTENELDSWGNVSWISKKKSSNQEITNTIKRKFYFFIRRSQRITEWRKKIFGETGRGFKCRTPNLVTMEYQKRTMFSW